MKSNQNRFPKEHAGLKQPSTKLLAAFVASTMAISSASFGQYPASDGARVQSSYQNGTPTANIAFEEQNSRGFVNPFTKLFGKKDGGDSAGNAQARPSQAPHGDRSSANLKNSSSNGTARSDEAGETRTGGGLLVPLKSFTEKVLNIGRSDDDQSTVEQSLPQHAGRRTSAARRTENSVGSGLDLPEVPPEDFDSVGAVGTYSDDMFQDDPNYEMSQSQTGQIIPSNRAYTEPFQSKKSAVVTPTVTSAKPSGTSARPFFESKPAASSSNSASKSAPSNASSNATVNEDSMALPPITPSRPDDSVTTRKLSDTAPTKSAPITQGFIKPLEINPVQESSNRSRNGTSPSKPSLLDLSSDVAPVEPAKTSKSQSSKDQPLSEQPLSLPVTTDSGKNAVKSSSAGINLQETSSDKVVAKADSIPLPSLPAATTKAIESPTSASPANVGTATEDGSTPSLSIGASKVVSAPELPAPSLGSPAELPAGLPVSAPALPTSEPSAAKEDVNSKSASPNSISLPPSTVPTPAARTSETATVNTSSKQVNAPIDLRKSSSGSTGGRAENLGTMNIPGVEVTVHGPNTLLVGQETMFEIVARNQGATDLNGLLLRLTVPASVNLGKTFATDGMAETEADGAERAIVWELPSLPVNTHKSLRITITTEKPEHFALAVEWTAIPQSQEYAIQVQQPKLDVAIEGASEAVFGAPQSYRIRVRNPGNAVAKNVELTLEASTYGRNTSNIGDLAPGGEEVIDVELLFEKAGDIPIVAIANSTDSNVQAQASIGVQVNQAALQATIHGPAAYYQGSNAHFEIELTNTGKADAMNTECLLTLPAGADPVSLPDGAKLDGNKMVWTIPAIASNQTLKIPVDLLFEQTGENLVQFTAKTVNGSSIDANHTTAVDAITDLQLTVNDPVAPAPVGKDVFYDLEIVNRGRKVATSVNVLVQFSEGIEPVRNEGHEARLVPGQVIFNSIPQIAPGERVKLRVVAEASKGGVHRFRVEVKSDNGEADLLQEASTRFLESASSKR